MLSLMCDCCEWQQAKPLNKVGVQREKPISPALAETLREQDRLMRINGRPRTHRLVHSACIQFSSWGFWLFLFISIFSSRIKHSTLITLEYSVILVWKKNMFLQIYSKLHFKNRILDKIVKKWNRIEMTWIMEKFRCTSMELHTNITNILNKKQE